MRSACFVAVALALALGVAAAERMPSPVIYPLQRLPLSFSHARHLALDLACDYCHEGAATSRRGADRNLPAEAVCATCHPIDRAQPTKEVAPGKPDARCDSCHPGWDGAGAPPAVLIPTPNLKFNHELHVSRGAACTRCHGDLAAEEVNLATRAQLPRMPLCLECHDGKQARGACTTCHLGDRDGRVRTVFPEGQLLPSGTLRGDAHDLRFRTEHAAVARNDEKYCASCHVQSFCLDCHDGVRKPMDIHANDYVSLHALDARRNATECAGCHRQQTFCTGCHARSGVSDDPRTSQFERESRAEGQPVTRRFHPDGWWSGPGELRSRRDHSFEAQRNLRACASCHREEFCRECHGSQINPHPGSWRGSLRCRSLLARNGRTCLRCHTDVNEVRCD
jgi:hypothetical protein